MISTGTLRAAFSGASWARGDTAIRIIIGNLDIAYYGEPWLDKPWLDKLANHLVLLSVLETVTSAGSLQVLYKHVRRSSARHSFCKNLFITGRRENDGSSSPSLCCLHSCFLTQDCYGLRCHQRSLPRPPRLRRRERRQRRMHLEQALSVGVSLPWQTLFVFERREEAASSAYRGRHHICK